MKKKANDSNRLTYVIYFPFLGLWKVGSSTRLVDRFKSLKVQYGEEYLRLDGLYGNVEDYFHEVVRPSYSFERRFLKKEHGVILPAHYKVFNEWRIEKFGRPQVSKEFYDFYGIEPDFTFKVLEGLGVKKNPKLIGEFDRRELDPQILSKCPWLTVSEYWTQVFTRNSDNLKPLEVLQRERIHMELKSEVHGVCTTSKIARSLTESGYSRWTNT